MQVLVFNTVSYLLVMMRRDVLQSLLRLQRGPAEVLAIENGERSRRSEQWLLGLPDGV